MILRGAPMSIALEDLRVFVSDSMAFVTCVEVMDAGDSRGRCTCLRMLFTKEDLPNCVNYDLHLPHCWWTYLAYDILLFCTCARGALI